MFTRIRPGQLWVRRDEPRRQVRVTRVGSGFVTYEPVTFGLVWLNVRAATFKRLYRRAQ
jgi:hypothetical protein